MPQPGSLLSEDYPTADQWRSLVEQFSSDAIAHKLLLAHIPYVFRNEPLKFALFRRTIADSFKVEPTNVFIVGSAMAGRSLKGDDIDKEYSSDSDIDTLIVSEPLFTSQLMKSLEWVADVTRGERDGQRQMQSPTLTPAVVTALHRLSSNAQNGIWRPDSLPADASVRQEFFRRFERVSLHTLGLQLSDDTVAKVNGRVARSFEDAVSDLSSSLYRLKKEFREQAEATTQVSRPTGRPAEPRRPTAASGQERTNGG